MSCRHPALLLAPVIGAAIKLDSPGPVLYSAERVGRMANCSKCTSSARWWWTPSKQKKALEALNEADGPIFKIKDDPRLTRVGRWLRRRAWMSYRSSVMCCLGQMSLVGPRPPLPEEVEEYRPWHRQRLTIIGGITGLWQVSGRSDLTFDELCLLDIYYIENWSLVLDVRILLQTIPHALFGRGAY